MYKYLMLLLGVSLANICLAQNDTIPAQEAHKYVGEIKTVLCEISDVAEPENAKSVFLNVGGKYPKQIFTIAVWKNQKAKYGINLPALKGQKVYVKGKISLYKDKPQMRNPEEIKLVE